MIMDGAMDMKINRFQLIEAILLVTVLIGLFSLLIPVIYNSRHQAQTTACLSNLSQHLGNQIVTYTTDHDGDLPAWEDGWINALSSQAGYTLVDQTANPTGVWACPSQDPVTMKEEVPVTEWWRGSHYGINVHITSSKKRDNGDPLPLWTRANVRQIRSAHDKAILGDSSGGNVFNLPGMDPTISGTNPEGLSTTQCLPPNPLPGMPYRRHQGGASNILFLDLHAETLYNFPKFMLGRGTPGFNFWHGEHWYPEIGLPQPGIKKKPGEDTVTPASGTTPAGGGAN